VVAHTADVLVRRRAGEGVCPMEVRVAIIGNVDSGKSTLVGVLTRSMLDDGRGLARGKVRGRGAEGGEGKGAQLAGRLVTWSEASQAGSCVLSVAA
jgi:GTPase